MNITLRERIVNYVYLFLDFFVIVVAFFLENAQVFFRTRQFPDVTMFSGYGWRFIPSSFWTLLILAVLLKRNDLYKTFLAVWTKNRSLFVFVVAAVVSLVWTVYFPATLYKLILLIFSTLVGAYIGVRYRISSVIDILSWIAILCTVFSFFLIIFTPHGIMWNVPFTGSWNGMFWHRNHAGSLFAFFNMIFLVRLMMDSGASRKWRIFFGLMYILTAIHVVGSRSAGGMIVFLVLNFATVVGFAWVRWHSRFKAWHYYLFAAAMISGLAILLTNLEFFFGLLGRTSTMTGRTPLWQDLFLNFYLKKPFLGYGYGALWMQESFRLLMQTRHKWTYPVYFADNGFFDILLNLGLLGFLSFLFMYGQACVRSIQQLVVAKNWMRLFTVLSLLYILVGNLSYSFLLEVDQFVWMILVIMVFVISQPQAPG